jgi:flagellar protein FliJ
MKSRDTALNLKRFEADEKARKVADLEHMIREFENMAADLDRQIKAEEDRTHIKDPAHFAYSTFGKSASQRRDNLLTSAEGLGLELEADPPRAQ